MSKHTKTPWEWKQETLLVPPTANGKHTLSEYIDELVPDTYTELGPDVITYAGCGSHCVEVKKEDADFILKAVNSHDQLVEALKKALEHENHEGGKCGCCWTLEARKALESVGEYNANRNSL